MLTTETWEMVRMTTTEPQYSRKHCLLALYAALDKLVLSQPENTEIARQVERYLPGTTGVDQRGWSTHIERLIFRLSNDSSAAKLPDITTALEVLVAPQVAQSTLKGTPPPPPPPLTVAQRARLVYVTAVLSKLGLPAEKSDQTEQLFNTALALAAPGDRQLDPDSGAQLRATLRDHFHSHDDYDSALDKAGNELVSDELKRIGPPCRGWVGQSGSESCAILFSIIKSQAGSARFADVVKVAEPGNWADHNTFFCEMQALQPSPDPQGWSRVLEHVSTDCQRYQLRTAVKYWTGEVSGGTAYVVNYDLDDNRPDTDDGLVVVDSGTIYISETNTPDGPVVEVQSTKHVKIDGLSVTATAMWTCLNGWNHIGEDMFFGSSQAAVWYFFTSKVSATKPVPKLPKGMRKELVEESVAALTGCIDDATKMSSQYASRWLAGELQLQDYIDYGAKMAARVASEPWRFLARVMNRTGAANAGPPSSGSQSGGRP
jgi:hypothetical protein